MTDQAALLSSPLARGPGALPRQRQLIQRLKQAILAGQLPAGGKLPASRVLADELDISRNTVLIAYEQLTAEGYVIADRQGTRVAPLSATAASAARQAAQRTTGRAADQATEQATGQSAGRGSLPEAPAFRTATRLSRIVSTRAPNDGSLPLTPGTPALTQFPINAWRRARTGRCRPPPPPPWATARRWANRRCAKPSPNTCGSRAGCAATPRASSSPKARRARWRCACNC